MKRGLSKGKVNMISYWLTPLLPAFGEEPFAYEVVTKIPWRWKSLHFMDGLKKKLAKWSYLV